MRICGAATSPRAAALLAGDPSQRPAGRAASAAVLIATQKEAEAIAMLEARLAATPDDQRRAVAAAARAVRAIGRETATRPPPTRERFTTQARAYIDAKGVHCGARRRRLAEALFFLIVILSGGGAGGLPGVFSEYSLRDATVDVRPIDFHFQQRASASPDPDSTNRNPST